MWSGKMNNKILTTLAFLTGCPVEDQSPQQCPEEDIFDDPTAPIYTPPKQETILSVFPPTASARLHEALPDENFAGKSLYLGASADSIDVALLQYDVSLLEGRNVENALLRFHAGQTCHSSYIITFPKCERNLVIEAHTIKHSWEEQTVTWNSFQNAYDSNALKTVLLNVPKRKHKQYTIDVTAAVQDWVSDTENYGLALIADEKGRQRGRFQQTDTVLAAPPELVVYSK